MKKILKRTAERSCRSLIVLIAAFLMCGYSYGQQINSAEYFFDADPGVGKGTAITVTSPGNSVDVSGSINTIGLSVGFHALFIRMFNASRVWSIYEGGSFYINAPSLTQVEIANAEYFFDNDPGTGNGTPISTSFAAADSIDVLSNVNTGALSPGFHALFLRVQNQSGMWSLYEGRRFYINAAAAAQVEIAKAEYFFDNDPGPGNGTPISTSITAADSIDVLSNVNTSALPTGFHTLFLRVQNQSGVWSLYEGRIFYINTPQPTSTQLQIVNAESFFDIDPGTGNGTTVSPSFTPADSVDLFRGVTATGLSDGTHYLFVRAQNELGDWGLAEGDSFNVCTNAPVADFKDSISGLSVYFTDSSLNAGTYSWNFGDGDTSTAQSPSHIYTAYGTYNVTLTIKDTCGTNTVTDTLVINNTTGINQFSGMAGGATIYPNPNNGNFTLLYHLLSANAELQIMDITGRLIYSEAIAGNEGLQQISTSNLSNGIFYWRIVSENKLTANGKIVIVR